MNIEDNAQLSELIKKEAAYFKAPPTLQIQVSELLSSGKSELRFVRIGRFFKEQSWWKLGGSFAIGVAMTVTAFSVVRLFGAQDYLTGQIVDSHVRSLMVAHLSDVASTDQHTVKPWLSHQLDFSPPVVNPTDEGYKLVGGRLDYIDGRAVAALVYQKNRHTINVFVWPSRDRSAVSNSAGSRQGFNVKSWEKEGMQYWAVSDIPQAELDQLAGLLSSPSPAQ